MGGGGAGLVMEALRAHITDPKGAHEATAIEYVTVPPLSAQNMGAAFSELGGGFPPEPAKTGLAVNRLSFHCVPDWGVAKMSESSIHLRDTAFDNLSRVSSDYTIYPYHNQPRRWTWDWGHLYTPGWFPDYPQLFPAEDPDNLATQKWAMLPFDTLSPYNSDILADRMWNSHNLTIAGLPFKTAGNGLCHAGAFTLSDGTVQRTSRLMTWENTLGLWPPVVTLSGAVHPADRGVLALIHIPQIDPAGTDWTTLFLAQSILERCPAALLLGTGIVEGDACVSAGGVPCDGEPGGIFEVGTDTDGNEDPFAFPGKATGQYDLKELHTGISVIDGITHIKTTPKIRAHWASGGAPAPGAGQVRLGTDPDAGGGILAWGIPILGAGADAYDTAGGAFPLPTIYTAVPYVGKSLAVPSNFFRYRLPVLDDYSSWSGLKWTPRGTNPATTFEAGRYFTPATGENPYTPLEHPALWTTGPSGFDTAGNYPPFSQDNFTWQIARFRHTFIMDGGLSALAGDPPVAALGTWVLIHFKTERDFEAMVVNATVPDSVHGAHFLSDHSGVVNDWDGITPPTPFDEPPHGPSPRYGFASAFHHAITESVFLGGEVADHIVVPADVTAASCDYVGVGGGVDQMWVSGIRYQTARIMTGGTAGNPGFWFIDVDATVDRAWRGCWRTDLQMPPVVSDGCPAFLGVAPFCNDIYSALVPPSGSGWLSAERRFEIDFQHLGTHGGAPFSDANGPTASDTLVLATPANVYPPGDDEWPAFSSDARLRLHLRRPLAHVGNVDGGTLNQVTQPYNSAADGVGIKLLRAVTDVNLLFHSTGIHMNGGGTDVDGGIFGNMVNPVSVLYPPAGAIVHHYPAWPSLFTPGKDVQERFLDEVYRYRVQADLSTAPAFIQSVWGALTGPGLGGWIGGIIPLPVRAGLYHHATDFPAPWDNLPIVSGLTDYVEYFNHLSFTQLQKQLQSLANSTVNAELQVAGLPDRNPPIADWVSWQMPSAGLLKYPNVDYATGYFPDVYGVPQNDYSALTGIRSWSRCFDAGFSRSDPTGSTPPVDVVGQSVVTFRIDGLSLDDFAWRAPGPGQLLNGSKIAILVKIPGLTTWMDLGRLDGSGPSKQDNSRDGAGCQISGIHTLDGVDPDTGITWCQVQANVGPTAALLRGISSGVGLWEVPVMVKVMMDEMTVGEYDLQANYDNLPLGLGPGWPSATIRGIVGIQIVHPTQIEPLTVVAPSGRHVGLETLGGSYP